MLKFCGCPYGSCCCGPAPTDKEKAEDKLLSEMIEFVKPFKFTAIFKDFVGIKERTKYMMRLLGKLNIGMTFLLNMK